MAFIPNLDDGIQASTAALAEPAQTTESPESFFYRFLLAADMRSRIRKGVVWNFVAAVSALATTFAVNIVIAKMLGRDTFGKFTMVQNTLTTFCGLASFSLGLAATKYLAEYRTTDREKAGRILGLCSLLSVSMATLTVAVLLALSHWVASSQLKTPQLAVPLRIGAAFLLFTAVNSYQTGALAGLERYRTAGIAGIRSGLSSLAICAGAVWSFGFHGAFIGLAASAAIRYLIHRHYLAVECKNAGIVLSYRRLKELQPLLFRFAIPAAVSGYFTLPMFWLANVILFRQPHGAASMALYGAAFSVRAMVLFLPATINGVAVSLLNHTKGTGDSQGFLRLYWTNVMIVLAAILAAAIPIALSGPLILALFGKDFSEGYPVFIVLLISAIPEGLGISMFQMLQAHEKMWFSFAAIIIPRELTFVGLAYLLAPRLGAVGLGLAYCVAWTLAFLIILISGFALQRNMRREARSEICAT